MKNTLNRWKHWPAFWALVREHDVCPESDKERLGECEIELCGDGYDCKCFNELCDWMKSGFAGEIMEKLTDVVTGISMIDLSTYTTPKTVPLPIVKPCHRCGMEHDEMHPTEACKRLMDADQEKELLNARIKELELDNGLAKLCIEQTKTHIESAENHIAELDARFIMLKKQYEELFEYALFYSRHSGDLHKLKSKHKQQNEHTNEIICTTEAPHA